MLADAETLVWERLVSDRRGEASQAQRVLFAGFQDVAYVVRVVPCAFAMLLCSRICHHERRVYYHGCREVLRLLLLCLRVMEMVDLVDP
jgi:hypothetical protein